MNIIKEFMVAINTKVDLSGFKTMQAETSKLKSQLSSIKDGISPLRDIAISYGFGKVIQSASDFQYQMQLIGNTANASKEEIQGLTNDVLDLSTKANQLPEDMQKALGFLIAAGMDKQQAKDSLEVIGKTATATASDIEDVSKTVFALESNLKVMPNELGQTMDILAAAGKEGNFELKDMATYLPTITAGYQSLGATGTKAAASLGAALQISRMGAGDSSEAANNLRNFLQKLTAPETVKNFKKFGVNLKAEIQKGVASGDLIGYMTEVIKKITGGDKFKTGQLFGDMQVMNFLNPMIANLEKYKEIKEKSLNAKSVVDTDFEKMLGTSHEQMKALKIQALQLGVSVGTVLLPSLIDIVAAIKPLVVEFANWAKEHPNMITSIAAIALGITGLSIGFTVIGSIIGGLRTGWMMLTTVLSAFRIAMFAVNAVMLMNPVIAITAGIVALGAAIYAVIKYWDQLKAAASGAWDTIKSFLPSATSLPNLNNTTRYESVGSAPTPAQAALMNNSTTNNQAQNTTVNNDVKINVQSTDPASAGREVGGYVNKVNRDSINQSLSGFAN